MTCFPVGKSIRETEAASRALLQQINREHLERSGDDVLLARMRSYEHGRKDAAGRSRSDRPHVRKPKPPAKPTE